jgi:hypothetical protein
VTVRYGGERLRYHLDQVQADDLKEAMTAAAGALPPEIVDSADLVEIRPAVDPEDRTLENHK